jgi:hypothetical protein
MSKILTEAMAERAIDLSLPFIEGLMADGLAKRTDGYLIVSRVEQFGDGFVPLVNRSFGDPATWEHPYREVATSKNEISCRTGLTSREVQLLHPELIAPGDTIYYGSAVSKTIVVAFSGVDAYIDELIAKVVLATSLALVQQELERQKATGTTIFA